MIRGTVSFVVKVMEKAVTFYSCEEFLLCQAKFQSRVSILGEIPSMRFQLPESVGRSGWGERNPCFLVEAAPSATRLQVSGRSRMDAFQSRLKLSKWSSGFQSGFQMRIPRQGLAFKVGFQTKVLVFRIRVLTQTGFQMRVSVWIRVSIKGHGYRT